MELPGDRESRLFEDISEESQCQEPGLRSPLLSHDENIHDDELFQRHGVEEDEDSQLGRDESSSTTLWLDNLSMFFGLGSNSESMTNSVDKSISISAIFLRDYEHSRPSSLSSKIDTITPFQLRVFRLRFSLLWQCILHIAIASLFVVSCFDGNRENSDDDDDDYNSSKDGTNDGDQKDSIQFTVTLLSVLILSTDVAMRTVHDHEEEQLESSPPDTSTQYIHARKTRARWWKFPVLFISLGIVLETYMKMIFPDKTFVWMGVFKPVIFFYVSSKARDALTALYYVGIIVFKVILIELFLLLSFSAMACHLYFDFDAFRDLPSSFLSLFELQTTAATPSLWISIYNVDRSSAIFFISFLIICVFYVHSIVLSVVFQTYIHSMKRIRERAFADRHETLKLAFFALDPCEDSSNEKSVDISKLRKVFLLLRPHYSHGKIEALLQIVDPENHGRIRFSDFCARLQKVLHTSLRSTRQETRHSIFLSSLSLFVAATNLVYVLIFSSALEFLLLSNLIFPVGYFIVLLGLAEVILRIRPCSCLSMLSTTRHGILDGLAIFAGLISLTGLILHGIDNTKGLQWLLLGRAIDTIRILRFSSIFRSIIRRSDEVLPAIIGPLALVFSSMHIFTYLGMALWGGAVTIGIHNDSIQPLYDLNNFNDYASGLLTMFNILVVNDWQAIAGVYLIADRFYSPYIVYSFFISANLVNVNILLNVLTAFFVGAFVTKVEDRKNMGENNSGLHVRMSNRLDQESSLISGFHVIERRGYESVISTIAGDEGAELAKKACELLETFGKLRSQDTQMGFLVCCRDYFSGNEDFFSLIRGYIEEEDLNRVVSEIFNRLLTDQPGMQIHDEFFSENDQKLTLDSSICVKSPALALIVASLSEI